MTWFCLHDHPQLPLVRASVTEKRPGDTRDGFRLRYCVRIASAAHGDDVIGVLDGAMGVAFRFHGIYQAKYDDVRAAYGRLLESAGPRDHQLLRRGAAIGACALAALLVAWTFVAVPFGILAFMAICLIRQVSGPHAMFDVWMIMRICNRTDEAVRLVRYARAIW